MTSNITDSAAVRPPFNPETCIRTRVSNDLAIVRVTIAAAFACLAALRWESSVWRWPVVYGGLAIVAWTAYTHLFSTDPLVKTFHTIFGGKEAFEQLPRIDLEPINCPQKSDNLIEAIMAQTLRKEFPSIARAQTKDGRQVLIVECSSNSPEVEAALGLHQNGEDERKISNRHVLVFVERFEMTDKLWNNPLVRIWGVVSKLVVNHPDSAVDPGSKEKLLDETVALDEEWFGEKADLPLEGTNGDGVGVVVDEEDEEDEIELEGDHTETVGAILARQREKADTRLARQMGIRTIKQAQKDTIGNVLRQEIVIDHGVPKKLIRHFSHVMVAGSISGKVANEIHALFHSASVRNSI